MKTEMHGRSECGEQSDADLLTRFIESQNHESFRVIVARHGPMVLALCKGILRREQDAEDAFQATFLVLAKSARKIRRRTALASWLHRTAYHICLKASARIQRRKEEQMGESIVIADESLKQVADQHAQSVLHEELNSLPEKYRAPLVICYLEGKSREEAARQLGCSVGVIKGRLERGRQKLRARLLARGVTSTVLVFAATGSAIASEGLAESLIASTVEGAIAHAGGQATAGGISTAVLALTEGETVIMSASLTTRTFAAFVLTASLLGALGLFLLRCTTSRAEKPVDHLLLLTTAIGPEHADNQTAFVSALAPQKQDENRVLGGDPKVELRIVKTHGSVDALAWPPNGKLLAMQVRSWDEEKGITGHAVKLYDVQTGKAAKTIVESDVQTLKSVAISHDGRSVAVSIWRSLGDRPHHVVKVCDIDSGKERTRLTGAKAPPSVIACATKRDLLASAGVAAVPGGAIGEVCLWNLASGKLLWRVEGHTGTIHSITFSHDSRWLATASRDGTIKVWDVDKGACARTLKGHGEQGVYSVAFSPDGTVLASGGLDGTVRLWEATTGKLKQILTDQYLKSLMVTVAFAPDGRTLATAGDTGVTPNTGNVKLWDPETGRLKRTATDKVERIYSLAFSPDGSTLAVGCWGKKLVLLPVAN